ncbi:MAG: chaperonin GroEL [Candidatus Sungbacteria bacterium]|uniref:Chaperonin GroEL n=1 Tax=Candidatus Sungiibacteriota bacterium TaxID=2750080 RepID=A0A9D6HQL6_9BACT|nr:chaperonin GroEL [Candidatus Sungbacteria bacterium]
MAKQILFNESARTAMRRGIDKLAEAVKMTLGPRGRAVIIEKSYGAPQVTFDGVTVAKEIELQDKYENLGAEFIKQAADKTNTNVGDGTTTAVVLAQAMIKAGEESIRKGGFNVIQLAGELKEASEAVIKNLETQRELLSDSKKIQEVATLSAKDATIGKLIAEVVDEVGKDGVISVEDSNTIGSSHEIVEGLQFDRGYISQYMVTNAERMESVYENPLILITDKKLSALSEVLPLLEKLAKGGKKNLVIIADDVEGESLATLVVNKIRGTFNALAIKAPGFGDRRKEMLEDIAILTGGEVVSEEKGLKLDAVDINVLGEARRVISTKENTTIIGGAGNKAAIEKRIKQIKAQIAESTSEFDKEKLEERLGKLSGGVAIIKVGAPTESAQKELKQRVEDAVAATKAAMEEGIVPGGGMALFNIILKKEGVNKNISPVALAAAKIMQKALRAPVEAIIENSGESVDEKVAELIAVKSKPNSNWIGFNAITNTIGNLKDYGIVDPLKVTKTAFINAISVAANYLTVGAAVTDIPEKKETPAMPQGGMEDY